MTTSAPSLRQVTALVLLTLAAGALLLASRARAADFAASNETELIAAIAAANAAGAGTHTIALNGDITLSAPLPALDNSAATSIEVDGNGHTLDGGGHRILTIATATAVAVQDVAISNGQTAGDGGAILVRGRLNLTDATISDSHANRGGAIFVDGILGGTTELALLRVTIRDNVAALDGGGIAAVGDEGQVTITIVDSTITANRSSGLGGGLLASGFAGSVNVNMQRSTVSGNEAHYGAGVFMNGNGGQAILALDATTVASNAAAFVGGGLFLNGNNGLAAADVFNSTVSGNQAKNGGGIAMSDNGGAAEMSLRYATVAANPASSGSALRITSGAALTTTASILAAGGSGSACAMLSGATLTSDGYNLAGDDSCGLGATGDINGGTPDLVALALNAPGTTMTHALGPASDALDHIPTGAAGCGTTVTTDQRGLARPAPAAACDSGAFESDSDTTPPTPSATPSPTVGPSPTPTASATPAASPTPSATPPASGCAPPYAPATETALNLAIACINAAGPGSHTITLAADLSLSAATMPLNNAAATEVRLVGAGHTLDGNGRGPIVSVAAGTTARLSQIVLVDGAAANGAAVFNAGVLVIENSHIADSAASVAGGGIYNSGRLTLKNSAIVDNTAATGGGIATAAEAGDAAVTIMDSTISGNTAGDGGGLWAGADGQEATVTLKNSTFSGNEGSAGAGGMDLRAGAGGDLSATVSNTRFLENSGGRGGGLSGQATGGELAINIDGGIIRGNSAADGGGVALSAGGGGAAQILVAKATLFNNAATAAGGAIAATAASGGNTSLSLFNATLSANAAGGPGGGLMMAGGGAVTANIVYSTLAGNSSATGGGGLHTAGSSAATLTATIITNGAAAGPDCARPGGTILSTGYNLAGDNTCFLTEPSDLPAAPASLLPLALNAPGNTPTHALSADSLARDRVPVGSAACGTAITTDQRGVARPQPAGGRCDAGAFELRSNESGPAGVYMPLVVRQ